MPVGGEVDAATIQEYENNPDFKTNDLIRLREWLGTQKHLPEVKDELLLLCHHSCYYDLERTKECIDAYYTIRTNTPQLFTNRDITSTELETALAAWHSAVLPVLDPRGYRIIYGSIRDPDPSKFIHSECLKMMLMTIDSCLARYGPESGLVIIMNTKEAKLGHLFRVSIASMKKFIMYNQDANPTRLKELHIVNVVPWIDRLLSLVKPFMKKEMISLLNFHTSNSESLYEFIPKECLPQELGGTLVPVQELHDDNIKHLKSMRDFFAEEEKFRVDESKREKKSKKRATEIETTLQNLDID